MHGVLRRDQLRGHSVLLAALQWVSVTVLLRAAGRIAATASRGSSSSSKDPITAFDRHGDDLVACAKLHSMVYSLQAFADRVQRWREPSAGADGSTVSSATQAVVHKLCSLFGINQLLTAAAQVPGRARRQSSRSIAATHSLQRNPHSHPIPTSGHMHPAHHSWLQLERAALCDELRPEMCALVDSFAHSDWVLNSALGCADGRVYDRYLGAIRSAPAHFGTPKLWAPVLGSTLASAGAPPPTQLLRSKL